jgi:phage replication-related protein YjqB (UPF0714/DUF867 family)
MDKYKSYEELKQHEREGEDYIILLREGDSRIALMAPHGGGIEPGTVEIADQTAGARYNFYSFKGIKKTKNAVLHITSNRFDELEGLRIAKSSEVVVSIHGYRGKDEIVFIGGRNEDLKSKIMHGLNRAGFNTEISTKQGLRGQHPRNICNLCRTGRGVQLEISRGLREKMFENLKRRSLRKKTVFFFKFVDTLREALNGQDFKREEEKTCE